MRAHCALTHNYFLFGGVLFGVDVCCATVIRSFSKWENWKWAHQSLTDKTLFISNIQLEYVKRECQENGKCTKSKRIHLSTNNRMPSIPSVYGKRIFIEAFNRSSCSYSRDTSYKEQLFPPNDISSHFRPFTTKKTDDVFANMWH